jgi:hypothetical protein
MFDFAYDCKFCKFQARVAIAPGGESPAFSDDPGAQSAWVRGARWQAEQDARAVPCPQCGRQDPQVAARVNRPVEEWDEDEKKKYVLPGGIVAITLVMAGVIAFALRSPAAFLLALAGGFCGAGVCVYVTFFREEKPVLTSAPPPRVSFLPSAPPAATTSSSPPAVTSSLPPAPLPAIPPPPRVPKAA